MYNLATDPLEMTNLAHVKHWQPSERAERDRLHRLLWDVMQEAGSRPDEIQWPEVDDFQPSTLLVDTEDAEDEGP